MRLHQKWTILVLLSVLLLPIASFAALPTAQDYYVFGFIRPAGASACYSPAGFVDETNAVGLGEGKHYLVLSTGSTGYLIETWTDGDPTLHPNDPENIGPVAQRKFNIVSQGSAPGDTVHSYHIDSSGIYYGASGGIRRYDFQWNNLGTLGAGGPPGGTQTFARNYDTGDFWCGTADRKIFRLKSGQTNWQYMFSYPTLHGSHHDGMTYANGSLFISDMTSDHIIQYRLDDTGNPLDPGDTPFNKFDYYEPSAAYVENMGIGPFYHIWVNAGWNSACYELGGGRLQQFLNKAPEVEIDTDADEGPVPLPVEFDATGSSDEDGFITLWEWDFDGDGKIDLAGHNEIGQDAKNIGGIPYSDPTAGFSCSSGQDMNIGGVIYCKYNSYQDAITDWFNNVEGFKGEGINTVEGLLSAKFDPYIWGGDTAQKIDALRKLVGMLRHKCTKGQYYTPPAACSQYCKVVDAQALRFDIGECILPIDIKEKLDEANSPAAPYYQLIFDLGKDKGIDPAVAMAFFAAASNYGGAFDLVTHTYLEEGDYTVSLTVTDNNGLSSTGSVLVTALPPVNQPPHADFKAVPREGYVPLTVDFDASPSYDPDGDPLGYYWAFSDRPDTKSDEKFELVFDSLAPIDVTLTVTDPDGESHSVTKQIRPYTFTGIIEIDITHAGRDETTSLKVRCKHDIPVELFMYKIEGENRNALVENVPYTCNSGVTALGPTLEGGLYQVLATTDAADCTRCSKSKYFMVGKKVSEIKSPETSPLIVALVALSALALMRKKKTA